MFSSNSSSSSCIFCNKDCKASDSRPYPNSKSKDRIHNKCQIKKSLADKNPVKQTESSYTDKREISKTELTNQTKNKQTVEKDEVISLVERFNQEDLDVKRAINERKMTKILEDKSKLDDKKRKNAAGQSFFFDLKAGIAKPHEKKRYLHHRNLCEIAARFDDQGFQEEAVGRAYDHTGKDLTLGDDSDDADKNSDSYDTGKSNSTRFNKDESFDNPKKRKHNEQGVERNLSKVKVDDKNPCWFCLSSPQVEKHLIVAIGDHCYLTLAKGGLCDEHFLLLPIEHIQSLNDSEGNSADLLAELESFKNSLVKYFSSLGKGVVFFERNFRSVHWQLQAVPIPLEVLDTVEDSIKSISKKHFKNTSYIDIPAKCSIRDIIPPKVPYFYWQIEPIATRFATQIQVKSSFFPIQFGRLVLSDPKILDSTQNVDWKSCVKTHDEYVELVKLIKEKYQEYDLI